MSEDRCQKDRAEVRRRAALAPFCLDRREAWAWGSKAAGLSPEAARLGLSVDELGSSD